MIKFLRRNQQISILFIFIYAIVTVFSIFFTQSFDTYQNREFSSSLLTGFISSLIIDSKIYFLAFLFTILFVLTIGFYLVRINIKYLIIPNRSQFVALFYLAITSFGYQRAFFSEAILGSLFLLFALDRIFGSISLKEISYRFFDAGILLSIGSMFYFNIFFLFPFLLLSQLTLRSHYRKELLFLLIGLLLPYLYLFSVYFIIGESVSDEFKRIWESVEYYNKSEYNWQFLAGLGFYILIIIIASIFALKKFTVTKIQVRKLYQLFFYLFLNMVAIYLFIPSAGDESFFLVSIPLSALLSIYYAECKSNFINNIFFILLIGIPLVVNFLS